MAIKTSGGPLPRAGEADALLDRTFEAMILRWETGSAPASLGRRVEALCRAGVAVMLVSGAPLEELATELPAWPGRPGRLYWSVGGGAELYEAGVDGACFLGRVGDEAAAVRRVLADLTAQGIGPGLACLVGMMFGPPGAGSGGDARLLVPEADRAAVVSVGAEPEGVPPGVLHLGGGASTLEALLDDQLARRADGRCPWVDEDPAWTVEIWGQDPELRRVHESLLTLADGRLGTRGAVEEDGQGSQPLVLASGVYREPADGSGLLPGPIWSGLEIARDEDGPERRILDLRTGVLVRERGSGAAVVRTARFAALARPGVAALRAEGPADAIDAGTGLRPPLQPAGFEQGGDGPFAWARTGTAGAGGIAAAAATTTRLAAGRRTVERLAAYVTDPVRLPETGEARRRLETDAADGFDRLLAEQRQTWAEHWRDAQISIDGDPQAELACRFALFHLVAAVADRGEAAVGARGLSGPAYAGHVFWDADVFILPTLAATRPAAARAMLEYRLRRLPPARRAAEERGLAGARFPWESARDGTDVTPRVVRDRQGQLVTVNTGDWEEHVIAGIAWAAWRYAAWTGEWGFLDEEGRALLTETARYWAARARLDHDGRAHLYSVIGPDEYHEPVDDNAYTNVMARWNLRRAAELVERDGRGAGPDEAAAWRRLADALVDGYDPVDKLYEQFDGFYRLEPLLINEVADPPVAAELLLGRERLRATQVIKQVDVGMLHHLVPEETAEGSLHANLAFYGPRTAHGSSLSPAIQAALIARDGRPDEALAMFRIACRLDLDDLTGTSARGLHVATMGGVWQALAQGFLGLRPHRDALEVEPRLPATWRSVELRLRFQGRRLVVRAGQDWLRVGTDGPVTLRLGGRLRSVSAPDASFHRTGEGWRVAS